MVVKEIINDMLPSVWPLLLFISVVCIALRIGYLIEHNKKMVIYKELLMLIFIIYVVCLYYILIYQNANNGSVNLIPFKEMFKYEFGSYNFMKNIIGNILLFIPFGFFSSYYLDTRKAKTSLLVTLIITSFVEGMQYYLGGIFNIDDIILNFFGGFIGYLLLVAWMAIKGKLPKFMKSDGFLSFLVIVIVALSVLFIYDINIFSYL